MEKTLSALREILDIWRLAWKLLLGQGLRRQRLVFLIQLGGIALGAFTALLVLTLSSSFERAIREKLYHYMGGLWIRYYGEEQESHPLPIEYEYIHPLRQGGLRVEGSIHLPVLLEGKERRYEGVTLVAVEQSWWRTEWRNLLKNKLKDWEGDSLIVLSRLLAKKLGLEVGEQVIAVWLAEPPRMRRLRVVALYEAHIDEIDRNIAFVPMSLGQTLLNWTSSQVQVAHVFVSSDVRLDSLAEALSWKLPYSYEILTLEAIFPDIFDWLELIEQNVQVILGIVLILSFFSAASAFLVLQFVQRLRYELCWALGAKPFQLWMLTVGQALLAVGMGTLLGEALAAILLFSQYYWEWFQLDAENYLLSAVPVYWYKSYFIEVLGVGGIMAVLLSVITFPRRRYVRLLSHAE
ncbi:MAG: hypothetical protein RMJ66_08845 [Bacteroidia bacterium]|nr:hypothetical protein [Bacteroidia bacterium]MDW8135155.1 hypothetical protein [Bacteroidia bacterium]